MSGIAFLCIKYSYMYEHLRVSKAALNLGFRTDYFIPSAITVHGSFTPKHDTMCHASFYWHLPLEWTYKKCKTDQLTAQEASAVLVECWLYLIFPWLTVVMYCQPSRLLNLLKFIFKATVAHFFLLCVMCVLLWEDN